MDRNWGNGIMRYPDPAIEVLDPRFKKYTIPNAAVERLHTGARWTEGPVWFGDGRYLLWSDIPNNRMLRWIEETGEVSVFRSPSNNSNGNTRDTQGRLVTCEHATRRITRTELDGRLTVLMDSFQSKRLNAPNDVVVHPDGHIWFTDPGYGILFNYEGNKAEFELPTNVYRLNPDTGEATVATAEIEKPNGLCFSPDYSKLYITDTGVSHKPGHPRQILVYNVVDNARLINIRGTEINGDGVSPGKIDLRPICGDRITLGLHTETTFRATIRRIVRNLDDVSVKEGWYGDRQVDVVIRNGEHILLEIFSYEDEEED